MLEIKKIKNILHYNKETGYFTWLVDRGAQKVRGKRAGYINKGYVMIKINQKKYLAHRLAWLYEYGKLPEHNIDHINRDKSDNRIVNLRDVPQRLNSRNRGLQKNNKSGAIGVSFRKDSKKWTAKARDRNGKTITLGCFTKKKDAIKARKEFEEKNNYYKLEKYLEKNYA